jgi:hypothetical protein
MGWPARRGGKERQPLAAIRSSSVWPTGRHRVSVLGTGGSNQTFAAARHERYCRQARASSDARGGIVLRVDEVSVPTAGILARVIGLGLGLLALVLSLAAWSSERRAESRALGLGVAVALLAGAGWSAYREDRWWMLAAGLIAAVLWIVFEEWRGRRKSRQAAEANSDAAG